MELITEEWFDKEGIKFRSLIIIKKISNNIIIVNKSQFLNEDIWVDATVFDYNVTICPIFLIQCYSGLYVLNLLKRNDENEEN